MPRPTRPSNSVDDPGKLRRVVGAIALLIFIPVYIGVVLWVHDRLPAHRGVDLVFFAITGIGWGVPVLPLLSWMGRPGRSDVK
jgi:hypothetical protein